jgi:hypothetical protein
VTLNESMSPSSFGHLARPRRASLVLAVTLPPRYASQPALDVRAWYCIHRRLQVMPKSCPIHLMAAYRYFLCRRSQSPPRSSSKLPLGRQSSTDSTRRLTPRARRAVGLRQERREDPLVLMPTLETWIRRWVRRTSRVRLTHVHPSPLGLCVAHRTSRGSRLVATQFHAQIRVFSASDALRGHLVS